MDLSKKEEQTTVTSSSSKMQQFKDALKMVPKLAVVVTSRILIFTVISLVLNLILLASYLFSRDEYTLANTIVPILFSAIMLVAMFMLSKSYGIQAAIEHIWNKKKHLFFDFVAQKTTNYLVKKNLPLTSEKTWQWLSEKPFMFMDNMPGIVRMICRKFFEKIPLADFFSNMVQLKAKLSENEAETAIILSQELQQRVNPSIVQASAKNVVLLLIANIVVYVVMFVALK